MKFIALFFLTGCATLLPDTYLKKDQYEFCTKACAQYEGLAAAGKTMLGDKKSCICQNNIVIDYDTKFHSSKKDDAEKDGANDD